ncbi:MAG: DUF1499 domain-containing protein [Ectothiorhodospiraceae bacterium]|nr:DUF1499 domain-containing protein [Ectothiorhodospiraceae bacterium]
MKTALIVILVLLLAPVVIFFMLGFSSKSGEAPGLVDGHLANCPDKPNCVSSENISDVTHYIKPITIAKNMTFEPLPLLKNTINDMGGIIQKENDNYISATFSSAIFGFVDDLEIRIDTSEQLIHLRSASRVGRSDAGVNKERIELFKRLYNNQTSLQ